MNCSPPGFSVHSILQGRILEWVAFLFSRGSSWPRDQTQGSCTAGRFFYPLNHQGSALVIYTYIKSPLLWSLNLYNFICYFSMKLGKNKKTELIQSMLFVKNNIKLLLCIRNTTGKSPLVWRLLEWVTFSFSRGSSQPSDWTQVSRITCDSLPAEPQGKPKNTGMGSLSLLQGIFLTQESNRCLLHCR